MGKADIRRHAPAAPDAIPEFERMLAALSARFINLPAADVDAAIDDALRRIAQLIGADRAQQVRFSAHDDAALVTHSGAVDGAPRVATPHRISEDYPWALQRIRDGHAVVIPDVDALPEEAAVDRARFRHVGVGAHLSVPLRVGGRVEGVIAFGCMGRTRDWPRDLVARVALLAGVFANALDHKRAQEALDAAMRFEQRVSEILAALLTSGRAERNRAIEAGLRELALTCGAERATLWQRDDNGDGFAKTHRWLADGVARPPDLARDDTLPWTRAQLIAGKVVRFARHADLPSEAEGDLAAYRALGIRSMVIVPLAIGGRVAGALSFASARAERAWPDALLPRVTLLGEVFASVFARDAAERREQDAQAQAAHAARVGTMGMLAASLVHELTQPLAASLANAETAADLLKSSAPDLTELRAAVDDIVADDRRVGELIQQLRRFLRRGEAERTDIDIRGAIDDALHLVARDAADKGVTIDVDIDAPLPAVAADRVQIQQVLLNLLSNGCDAVAAQASDLRHVALTASARDGGVDIEVADRGPGMDDATLARIFQPFFTTKPTGMGLGLSISRSIATAHGGRLSVRSTKGGGATFRLELPSRGAAPALPTPALTPPPRVAGTIYVIDDDAAIRRAIERQVASAGYRVEAFDTAESFLDHPRENGVGCIVSDMRMPGLSGLDLQASLAEAKCDLPIVFVSGHGDISTAAHALRAGAVNFLAKPFTKSALRAAVAEALARSVDRGEQAAKRAALSRRYDSMTPREREVFALVARGLLNKVVADRLGTAVATVKIHRGRVMEKMGAASLADLVRMAEALDVPTRESRGADAATRGESPRAARK